METQYNMHPHLASIGASLGRSLTRHIATNDAVHSAFADLAFEVELARQLDNPIVVADLLEVTS